MIYFDHAATTALRKEAIEAMEGVFSLYGNPSSAHEAGMKAREALEDCRDTMATLLGCDYDEVIFTSCGTEADVTAIRSVLATGKNRILTTPFEHHAVLRACEELERDGVRTDFLPVHKGGYVSPADCDGLLDGRTGLVSVMRVNNELGTLQPVREIAVLARQAGALMHTDAVQAVGLIPLSFRELGVDFLSLSAHKFGGPKGVGALICKRGTVAYPLLVGGGQERQRRAGTESLLLVAGMTAALKVSVENGEREREIKTRLRDRLQNGLIALGAVPLCKDSERTPGHLSAMFPGKDAAALLHALDLRGICVSAGSACASGSGAPSHALTALGLTDEQALSCLRFSLGADNTEEETDELLAALREIL